MYMRILGLALSLFPAVLFGQAFQWTTFTSTSSVVDMIAVDGRLWTATTGGVAGYDPVTGAFDIYTNTRGLGMNQTVAVGRDDRGFVWAGHGSGLITRVNPATGQVRQIDDLQQGGVFEITDIIDIGDEVFVSTNDGIYRFSYFPSADNYRVFEPINVLGGLERDTRVAALGVAGRFIYAATARGLARASLDSLTLSQSSAWTVFNSLNSALPDSVILGLQGYGDNLMIATANWIVRFDGTNFVSEANLVGVVDFSEFETGGTIFAAVPWQVFRRDPAAGSWAPFNPGLNEATGVEVLDLNGPRVFASLADSPQDRGGIVESPYPGENSWGGPYRAPGIGGNLISALWVDPQGRLWAGGGGGTPGVYVRQAENWTNYTPSTGYTHRFFYFPPTSFTQDAVGGIWAGSMGGGVAWFRDDTVEVFNSTDSASFYRNEAGVLMPRLVGISEAPNDRIYVETRVARNSQGDVYITNLEALNSRSLARVPREWIARGNNQDPWTYYSPYGPGVSAEGWRYIGAVTVDPLDRVWTGAGRNGSQTFVLDPRGTPGDTTNDDWSSYVPATRQDLVTCFEEINKEVLSWDIDQQGYLWVGTINGAYYTQGGVPSNPDQVRLICVVDLPVGRRVNVIHVDAHDNKWFGTDEGVAVLDRNFNWVHVFQSATSAANRSDLISNEITAITSNALTGEVWIGTADGLSRFTSPYVASGSGDFGELWPYPNPFRADGSQHLCVDPVRLGGHFDELRVYSLSGQLVRKLSWRDMTSSRRDGGCVGWDGRNGDGHFVAGGVYLLVASSNDGKSVTGKVAVLGK